jgi:hypothetical protein
MLSLIIVRFITFLYKNNFYQLCKLSFIFSPIIFMFEIFSIFFSLFFSFLFFFFSLSSLSPSSRPVRSARNNKQQQHARAERGAGPWHPYKLPMPPPSRAPASSSPSRSFPSPASSPWAPMEAPTPAMAAYYGEPHTSSFFFV